MTTLTLTPPQDTDHRAKAVRPTTPAALASLRHHYLVAPTAVGLAMTMPERRALLSSVSQLYAVYLLETMPPQIFGGWFAEILAIEQITTPALTNAARLCTSWNHNERWWAVLALIEAGVKTRQYLFRSAAEATVALRALQSQEER